MTEKSDKTDIEPSELQFLKDMGWYETEEELELLISDSSLDLERMPRYFEDPPLNYSSFLGKMDLYRSFIIQNTHIIGFYLNLDDNIPSSIKNLKKLKMLVLAGSEGYNGSESLEKKYDLDDIFAKIAPLLNLRYLSVINSRMREIPNLTKTFPKLIYLSVINSRMVEIPNLTKMFPKLIHLYLGGAHLNSTPKWLFKYAQKHNSRRYKREGVIEEEAEILGLLELISTPFWGYKFDDGKLEIDADGEGGCNAWPTGYRINDLGHVIELNLGYSNINNINYYALSYFPEEVCRLTHLERLCVCNGIFSKEYGIHPPWNNQKADAEIPEAIINLTKLRQFWSNAKFSNSLLPFLKSLEKFETDLEFYD
ncbi:MAG: hypothetical protein E3J90_13575 [Promethearchaeota archaeon]|nr:MAG: hypothetical protein E3J90_13575 [Candidatus Lokiarchaeota archaeon]